MHTHAANGQRFSYAGIFGRSGSIARSTVKILMATLIMFGVTTSAQAEGYVNPTLEKTEYWAIVLYGPYDGHPFIIPPNTATSAAQLCETVNKVQTSILFPSWQKTYFGTEPNISYYASLGALNCLFKDNITGIVGPYNTVKPLKRSVCPPNSTPGTPCLCDAGYKPDPTITKCIPAVLYTIALHNLNLGGELAPSASRSAYAQVMDGATAKSGIAVTLKTTAPAEAGTAILSPANGTTGGDGKFNFTFTAPPVAGTHTLTATCDGGKCSNQATGTVVVTACTIDPLPKLPADDKCTQSLEKGAGTDVNNACAADLTKEMETAASCVADKITKLALTPAYTKPSATYRSEIYQNHLLAVWKKSEDIKKKVLSNEEKQACATVIADVNAHMEAHGLDAPPSNKGSQAPHVLGRAIDIPRAVADAMIAKVTRIAFVPSVPDCFACGMRITNNVQDYINSAADNPPACNLRWGGLFVPYDPVHFQLPAN